MPKPLLRAVSFILAVCLVADPSLAAVSSPIPGPASQIPAAAIATFHEQAITGALREIIPSLLPKAGIQERQLEASRLRTIVRTGWLTVIASLTPAIAMAARHAHTLQQTRPIRQAIHSVSTLPIDT